jgi:hypothetical protein
VGVSKRIVRTSATGRQPWLDIVSYGRRGHRRPDRFTPAQLQHIALIVRRAPEVMVKVSGGGQSVGAVAAHAKYVGRHGKVEILTDDGERLTGREAAKKLTDDWDLEDREGQYGHKARGRGDRCAPRLVYNVVLSMPKLTNPDRLVRAASAFARESFALRHRYALALHTDTDHPHVHLIVKAVSEQGERLYVRKATLRAWREVFAEQLRKQGVPAVATPSPLRGHATGHIRDAVYRLATRGNGAGSRGRNSAASAPGRPKQSRQLGERSPTVAVRRAVNGDWAATVATLRSQGASKLADEVADYVDTLNRRATRPRAGLESSTDTSERTPTR